MKRNWTVIAAAVVIAVLAVAAADPALARTKQKAKPACVDRPYQFSWNFLALGPAPQPNGCAPPVYSGGQYVGQDPDPYIRSQLLRDPATGYKTDF
jgi:hypothetical protein